MQTGVQDAQDAPKCELFPFANLNMVVVNGGLLMGVCKIRRLLFFILNLAFAKPMMSKASFRLYFNQLNSHNTTDIP